MVNDRKYLIGGYFTYCQWCEHDGKCYLHHNEFMGVESAGKIDGACFQSHDDLAWQFSLFQSGKSRARCSGRIYERVDLYLPLQCECGTVISSLTLSATVGSFCAKFQSNKKGEERMELAKKIARERGVDLEEISSADLPEPNPKYMAAMRY